MPTLLDRYRGALLGLAAGDALGTTLEFKPPGTFDPIKDIVGGGPFNLEPGQWTDDTSMALCLAESLIESKGFDAVDQLSRYVRWKREGIHSSTGTCFDIGGTVLSALAKFERYSKPWSGSTDEHSAGNGSIMRLAPVPLFFARDPEVAITRAAESSRTTHGAKEAIDGCRYLAALIIGALQGRSREVGDVHREPGQPGFSASQLRVSMRRIVGTEPDFPTPSAVRASTLFENERSWRARNWPASVQLSPVAEAQLDRDGHAARAATEEVLHDFGCTRVFLDGDWCEHQPGADETVVIRGVDRPSAFRVVSPSRGEVDHVTRSQHMNKPMALVLGMAMTSVALTAQSGGGVAPHVAILKTQAETIRSLVLRTAEKVPENLYEFKPTPDVRSLGGVLGHIADGNNLLCGMANGDKAAPNPVNEKKTTRADLVAALKASFDACDNVFASTTDANAATPVDFFGQKQTRLGMLAFTNSHMWEHYGNLVTYMRLKNIVPTSSER